MSLTAEDIATRSAASMAAADKASSGLGIRIERVTPGGAELVMTVGPSMVNGHGICHGGFIFTLADTAFAFACNSYGQRAVAQHAQITFLAPGRLGMVLGAIAVERQRAERSGIYDVTVTAEDGTVIAEFRGHSRSIAGSLI